MAPTVEIVAFTKTDPALSPEPLLLVTGVALVDDRSRPTRRWRRSATTRRWPAPLFVLDAVPTTLEEQRKRQVADNPEGHRWAVDNAWLAGSAEEVVPAMRAAYTTLPSEKAFTIWFSMAPMRDLPDMAFSLQSEIYLASYVLWEDAADDERHQAWLRGVMADLEPVTVGQYLGDSDLTRRPLRFMSDEAWGGCTRSARTATRTGCSSATSPARRVRRTAPWGGAQRRWPARRPARRAGRRATGAPGRRAGRCANQ